VAGTATPKFTCSSVVERRGGINLLQFIKQEKKKGRTKIISLRFGNTALFYYVNEKSIKE
jgi:hypothetical protein